MSDFNVNAIDDVIHGRIRLGVMAYLVGAGSADFSSLKAHLETTDGNLSVHLRKLEDAGYISIEKSFKDRRPLTEISLTRAGRTAFMEYLDTLAGLLKKRRS